MNRVETLPAVPVMPAVTRILARHGRDRIEAFIAIAIDLLDVTDGNPDAEESEATEDDDPGEDDDPEEDSDPREEDNEDRCMAGDDRIAGGPALLADYGGFSATPSRYCLGMDEDMERESWPTFGTPGYEPPTRELER